MPKNIGGTKNPLFRSIEGAGIAFTAVTIVSGAAIALTNSQQQSVYKIGVYTSLIGTGCGALVGLVSGNKVRKKDAIQASSTAQNFANGNNWKNWRNFVVIRKVKESEEITSFYLKPEDNGEIPNFKPGQFLTIKLDIPGQKQPVIRTYSLSDYSDACEYYRLSIKREPAPKGLEVSPGIASNFMHDQIREGSIIPAKPPNGKFVLDVSKSLPAVLISNGVGITPMLSMAKATSRINPNRQILFLHGARDGKFHAFRDELTALAQQNPNLRVHFCYSRPKPEDEGYYHSVGYINTDLIKELVNQEAEYFLCGSPPFLQSIREGLKQWGVPESRVLFESFSQGMKAISASQSAVEKMNQKVTTAEVVFEKSGKTLTWKESDMPDGTLRDRTLLEFAEANNLNPDYSCRAGICGTCACKIREGEVTYQETPTAAIDRGSVLICISKPKTPKIVLDL
jgi:uncharacterized protein